MEIKKYTSNKNSVSIEICIYSSGKCAYELEKYSPKNKNLVLNSGATFSNESELIKFIDSQIEVMK